MRWKYLVLAGTLVLLTGVGFYALRSTEILDDPDEMLLFSVDPTQMDKEPEERVFAKGSEFLYECAILGKVEIKDPALRREVIAAVKEDIRSGHHGPAKCFNPRHVLRQVKNGRLIDVVICFQCHNYEIHKDGGPHKGTTPSMGENSKTLLNKILTDAAVPIAP